jgi:hypothetical protein
MRRASSLRAVVASVVLLMIPACVDRPQQHTPAAADTPQADQSKADHAVAAARETPAPAEHAAAAHPKVHAVEPTPNGEEIPAGDPVPTVKLKHDGMTNGAASFSLVTDFDVTPAAGPYRPMRGHAHVYVDGVERLMISEKHFTLNALTAGRHTVQVTLAATDHRTLLHHGVPVGDTLEIVIQK